MNVSTALDRQPWLRPFWMVDQVPVASGFSESREEKLVAHRELTGISEGALRFFADATRQPATLGSPYIARSNDDRTSFALQEFTAEIRLTGRQRGRVYVTASRAMLTIMLMRMGATDITTATMSDALAKLAAAVANGIGAALGDETLAWPPVVRVETRRLKDTTRRPLVAPIHWRNYTAYVAVCFE